MRRRVKNVYNLFAWGMAGLSCALGCGTTPQDRSRSESSDAAWGSPDLGDLAVADPRAGRDRPSGAEVISLDFSSPFSTGAPPFSSVEHPLQPTALWGTRTGPRPTNRFWMSVVLGDGSERINLHPYQVRARAQDLAFAAPDPVATERSVVVPAEVQLTLGSVETLLGHVVESDDALQVTLRYLAQSGHWSAPLVSGMAYVTARYVGLTPRIGTGGAEVSSVVPVEGAPLGTRLAVTLSDGQVWRVYSSVPIDWRWDASGLVAQEALTGDVRVAKVFQPALAPLLDAHASAIPLGARVTAQIEGERAKISFDWVREGTGPLLGFALPHQQERLEDAQLLGPRVRSLFGSLAPVEGDRSTLVYAIPSIRWDAPREIDPVRRPEVETALEIDASFEPDPSVVSSDPYFGGKQLAKLAMLIVIARSLGRVDLVGAMVERLRPRVEDWLNGTNSNPLVYDRTWGGIVTTRGLADVSADFGQGYYNDHHFHYGYLVYAAAVLAREQPEWALENDEKVLAILRDIMNPSVADPYFSTLRPFDFFFGHSWAGGLFVFGDGRNQESTSEAVNAWYAARLYGEASGHRDIEALGSVLLAMEIASSQKYWQLEADESDGGIYPEPFAAFGAVGILWETKVDAVTWFGSGPELVYGIQMLPFTPMTEALLDPRWIRSLAPRLVAARGGASPAWSTTLTMGQAVVDPESAWSELQGATVFDDGNSRTNTLYWLATRR